MRQRLTTMKRLEVKTTLC